MSSKHLNTPWWFLTLLISLPAVISCLYAVALKNMAITFHVALKDFQVLAIINLIMHTVGTFLYAWATRYYSRKQVIMMGLSLLTLGAVVILFSIPTGQFQWLKAGYFLLFLGANVGTVLTIILVRDRVRHTMHTIAKLLLGMCILPGAAVYSGFFLLNFSLSAVFIAAAVYGLILLTASYFISFESPVGLIKSHHSTFLELKKVIFHHQLLSSGLMMAAVSSCYYYFNSQIPTISFHVLHMTPSEFAIASNIPSIGMLLGTVFVIYLAHLTPDYLLKIGCLWSLLVNLIGIVVIDHGYHWMWLAFVITAGHNIGLQLIYPAAIDKALAFADDYTSISGILLAFQSLLAALLVSLYQHCWSATVHSLSYGYLTAMLVVIGLICWSKAEKLMPVTVIEG